MSIIRRAATAALTPLVRFVEWLFGPRAPGIDLWIGAFATSWATLLVGKPGIFDRSPLAGIGWLPDACWVGAFSLLAVLHGIGLANPGALVLRQVACLLSAWVWITVACSIATVEITTGVLVYAIIGSAALAGALYLSGQPRKAG